MPEELVTAALAGAKKAGIRNIVALRGDPPKGATEWKATAGGFACALDLVRFIRKEHGDFFHISVAGYPEGHPTVIKPVPAGAALTPAERARVVTLEDGSEAVCYDADYAKELAYLKEKVDAGAHMVITQMFFDTGVFHYFPFPRCVSRILSRILCHGMTKCAFLAINKFLCEIEIPVF